MSRSPSRDRAAARTGRTTAGASGGGGGASHAIGSGPYLLSAYATAAGTDETLSRTITFATPSTAGRDIIAINTTSAALTMPAGWTSIGGNTGGTVCQVWRLAKGSNTGIASVNVTRATTQYPFAMTIIEDDILSVISVSAASSAPSGGSWSTTVGVVPSYRNVIFWSAMAFQSAVGAAVSGYNNGLTQLGDTGVSSMFASDHSQWYTHHMWTAWVGGKNGSTTFTATATNTNTLAGWCGWCIYTVG